MDHSTLVQLGLPILQAALPALGTTIGTLVSLGLWRLIGLIKNKNLQMQVQMAVAYAQQKLDTNDAKLAYVQNFIKSKVGSSLSDEEIDHFIESAVLAMKQNQGSSTTTQNSTSVTPSN